MKSDSGISILIIEDEKVFSDLVFQVFEGFHRIIAENATQGLELFKEHCPDIVLLDIGLPDMNGLDLLPKLLEYDPEAFIVMLTKSRIASDVNSAKISGATGYITKPFSYNKVNDCIAKYKEYQKNLQSLSPDERADNLIKNLQVEALDEDLLRHQEEDRKAEEKKEAIKEELKNWSILFVDDYPTNRQRAGKQLKKLGCDVDIAESGERTLQMLNKKDYDFILLDSRMRPGMDGYETAKMIRKKEKDSSSKKSIIVAMAEFADELEGELWKKAQMDDYVRKPISFIDLREKIEKYINLKLEKRDA